MGCSGPSPSRAAHHLNNGFVSPGSKLSKFNAYIVVSVTGMPCVTILQLCGRYLTFHSRADRPVLP